MYNSHNTKGLKLMLDFVWARVIYVSKYLNTVFKIRLMLCVTLVAKLNLHLIFSFTVLCSQMKEELSLVLYVM